MAFYIVPKRKMIPPEETPAITIIEQIQEGDTYYTDWWADFPFRIRIPVGEDKFDSGAVNQQAMTFYPNPDTETTSVDGRVSHVDLTGDTWDNIHGGVADGTAGGQDDATSIDVDISSYSVQDKWKSLFRAILLFDTSALPNNCTVTNVTLSVYGIYKIDTLGISPTLNVYTSAPASNTAVVAGDYDSLGTTPLCDTAITYANYRAETVAGSAADNGWNHFALNATGIALISKTGITKLGLREATYDATDTEPTWAASDDAGFWFTSADETTEPNPPRLTVTYEEYGGGVWIEGEKLHIISQTGTEQIALNESTFDANTILKADSNDTPEALTVAVQRILGRITAGEIDALTGAQALTILTGQAGATFSWNSQALTSVSEITLTPKASSSGAEGTIFYDSDDDSIYVATE